MNITVPCTPFSLSPALAFTEDLKDESERSGTTQSNANENDLVGSCNRENDPCWERKKKNRFTVLQFHQVLFIGFNL